MLTAAARRALAELDPELVAQTVLERTAEAPERLARHLAAVARRLLERMSETDASAEEQARVVNWAIELLAAGEAADEDVVALPPDLLIGVREPAEGLGAPYLPGDRSFPCRRMSCWSTVTASRRSDSSCAASCRARPRLTCW